MAAVLFGGTEAVLSHRSAAELWVLRLPRRRAIDVTRRRGRRASPGVVVHRDSISAEEIETAAELDGMQAHGTDLAFEKDRERDRLLIAEGWRVARITWRQLRDDAPSVLAGLGRVPRP
jgi:DNA-directed RNA polymerase specialized sigma24 family protein